MSNTLEDFNLKSDINPPVFSEPRKSKPLISNNKEKASVFMTQLSNDKKRFNEIEPNKKQIYELIDNITRSKYTKDSGIEMGINEDNNTVVKVNQTNSQANDKFLYSISTRDFRVPKPAPDKKVDTNPPQQFPIRKNINFIEYNIQKQSENKVTQPRDNIKEIIQKNADEELQYKKEMIFIRKQEKEMKRSMIEQEKEERSLMKRQMSLADKADEPKVQSKESPSKYIRKRVILPISSIYINADIPMQAKPKVSYINQDTPMPELHKKEIMPVMHYDELINQLHDILFYNPSINMKKENQSNLNAQHTDDDLLSFLPSFKKMESIVLIPKVITFGDKEPRPINYSEYSENFSAFKVDVLCLIKYLQCHTDESVTIERLREILGLVGSTYNQEEMMKINEKYNKEKERKKRLEEIKESAEEERQKAAEEKLQRTMDIIVNRSKSGRDIQNHPNKLRKTNTVVPSKKKGITIHQYIEKRYVQKILKNVFKTIDKLHSPADQTHNENNQQNVITANNLNSIEIQSDSNEEVEEEEEIQEIGNTNPDAHSFKNSMKFQLPTKNGGADASLSRWDDTERAKAPGESALDSMSKSVAITGEISQRDNNGEQANTGDKKANKTPTKTNNGGNSTNVNSSKRKALLVVKAGEKGKTSRDEKQSIGTRNDSKTMSKQASIGKSSLATQNEKEITANKLEEDAAVLQINQLLANTSLPATNAATTEQPKLTNEQKTTEKDNIAQGQEESSSRANDLPETISNEMNEQDINPDFPNTQNDQAIGVPSNGNALIMKTISVGNFDSNSMAKLPTQSLLQFQSTTNISDIKAIGKELSSAIGAKDMGLTRIPEEGLNEEQKLEYLKQLQKRAQYNKAVKIGRVVTKTPAKKEEVKKQIKVYEEDFDTMNLEKQIAAQVQETIRKKEVEAENAKKVKEKEEKEVEEKKKKVPKKPRNIEKITTFLDAIDKERQNQGMSQLDDLKTLLLNDNNQDLGADCDKILKDFFNNSQFPHFHEATTSIEDVTPYFTEKDDSKCKEYYDLLEMIKRIQLFADQNDTIYKTKDMRDSTCIYQFPPNNEESIEDAGDNKDAPSTHKIFEIKALIAKFAEIDRTLRMRTKDLKRFEQDQLRAINPYRMLPNIEKDKPASDIPLKESKALDDMKLPLITGAKESDRSSHRFKANKEWKTKRDEMSQIEIMERRYQLLTQTKLNKGSGTKVTSCDPCERKLKIATYKY